MMASEQEVRGKQLLLMLDKATKHFRMANHWLDRARKEFPRVEKEEMGQTTSTAIGESKSRGSTITPIPPPNYPETAESGQTYDAEMKVWRSFFKAMES